MSLNSTIKHSILSIQQEKARAGVVSGKLSQGWDVTDEDLVNINRPVIFYLYEPLQTPCAAFGVFDLTGIETLVKDGEKRDGIPDEIFDAVVSVTKEWIANPAAASPELMDAVLTGILLTFCGGKNAAQIVEEKINHFGAIVYKNPLPKDDVTVTFRPIKISDKKSIGKEKIVFEVARYVFHDEPLLPEFFEGVNSWGRVQVFAATLDMDYIGELQKHYFSEELTDD